MECTNIHILIAILIIFAGVISVTLIYLPNLTVANRTSYQWDNIYANIISINDAVFLMNDNVYNPFRVFISFTNLDLDTDLSSALLELEGIDKISYQG